MARMNFIESIVEYRYFDQNLDPVQTRDEARVITARTDCQNFGKYWHAVELPGGWRIGSGGTLEEAINAGSTRVMSDNAATAKINFVDEGLDGLSRRKNWGAIIDGERVGHFTPNYGAGYHFVDRSGRSISIPTGYRRIGMEADIKADFESCVRRWFELIPDDIDIKMRDAAEAAEKAREEAEQAEARRVATIKDAGVELYEAAKAALDDYEAHGYGGGEYPLVEQLRTVIAKAEGKS